MSIATKTRLLLGLSAEVVPDDVLNDAVELAEDWCRARASAYSTEAPESAVVLMAVFFLRQHLDLAGIKPSSISMPDLTMATDVRSMCDLAKDMAIEAIKAQATARGQTFRHIRSGKVGKWH